MQLPTQVSEGDVNQSIEDSGNLNGDFITEKNTDDYKLDLKKGNSNILVTYR